MQEPLVSIIITAYNREDFLKEAIESVINSTYQHLEIIISDDCSKDRTVAIATDYAEKDSRIRLYINEKNLGDYPNRNKAASYALGEYLMWVDSDDIIFKDSIERCVQLMEENPAVNFGTYYREPADEPFILDSATALHRHFFEKPYLMIGPGGTITRRSYFEKLGGYPEIYGPANDMYFNLKATRYSPVLMIPFEIYYIRKHPGQEINNAYGYLYNNYNYYKDAFNKLDLPIEAKSIQWLQKKNKRRFVLNIIKYFLNSRNFSRTRFALRQASFSFRDAMEGIFH
ncbi:MAG: glycosyltransferase [Bacteroidota bacterium]|nr:glycosyltransferase [Bacteroidota bacterium]